MTEGSDFRMNSFYVNNVHGITDKTETKITKYILMHEDTEVLVLDAVSGNYQIKDSKHLPYGMRVKDLTGFQIFTWIERRISNLSRTFMNKVYIARDVGRDDVKVIQDSCAISIVDNFWIKTLQVSVDKQKDLCI